jgi:hypothetical protein
LYQGLSVSRRGLAVVFVLFCIPLFLGLRALDLGVDESVHSFAVEQMLVDGEWTHPKSSPTDTGQFLETPPLKFWIVAAPIALGLLPRDEFGWRFWDAVMGSVAFLYVFAIGSRLAGPVCGGVAVLLLFVHAPLVFDHGLRTNNMEAALFLAYCGGVFHFLEWGGRREKARGRHLVAATLYFVLGFMAKSAAVLFLPAMAVLGAVMVPATRQRLWTERVRFARMSALALLLIVPWFAYAWVQSGSAVVQILFPWPAFNLSRPGFETTRVQPWSSYFVTLWDALVASRVQWWVVAGVVVLIVQAVRRWWFEGFVVMMWAIMPLVAVSSGTSRLYHDLYPFLPPLMIAAGYLAALIMMLAPVVLRRWLERLDDISGKSAVALMARRSAPAAPLFVALALAAVAPVDAYQATVRRLPIEQHPLRDVSDCVTRVSGQHPPGTVPGLFIDSNEPISHPVTFYFRRIEPWTRQETASAEQLAARLSPPTIQPSLVRDQRYREYLDGPGRVRFDAVSPPVVAVYDYALLLPGPFRVCSPEVRQALP